MARSSSFRKIYALLRPHLRARVPALLGVLLLATVGSFSLKAPILLLDPLWNRVLFPEQAAIVEGEAPAEENARFFESWFESAEQRVGSWLFGDEQVIADEGKIAALWTVALLVLFLAIFSSLAEYAFTWISRWLSFRLVVDLRQSVARHLMDLSMSFHGGRSFGDVLSRVSNDVTSTLISLQVALRNLTMQPLSALFAMGVAAVAAPLPTLAVLLFLPLILLPITLLGNKVRKRSKRSLASLGASLEVLTEMFRGVRTVKAFRAEDREMVRYGERNERYLRASMRMVHARATIQATTTFLSHLGFVGLLLLIGWGTLRWGIFRDGGQMMGFILGISISFNHIRRVTRAVSVVQESAGAADRLTSLLEEPVEVAESPDPLHIESIGAGVRLEGVSVRYPNADSDALQDVTLEIRTGETLALVGPSGAGKSTLVDLVARFLDPTAGRVIADGKDLRDVSLDDWTRQFAMVSQVPFLFNATLMDNIRYGDPDATDEQIEQAAQAANIHDFVATLPEGYQTPVGDDGAHLSGGQRQRITIARAILKRAPVLLLDEATSALDSESEAVVQEALDRLMVDRTVIVIAHRLSTIRNADRIAVLDDGRVLEVGSHDELLARGGAYARLHEVQFAGV